MHVLFYDEENSTSGKRGNLKGNDFTIVTFNGTPIKLIAAHH
jgi:hypothetical protein